jgi:prophage tail gpP-like protein
MAERTKDILQYQATMKGHRDPESGRTYAIDTIAKVTDELCDIDEMLWVESVTMTYDESQGPTTQLTCWLPGSFVF